MQSSSIENQTQKLSCPQLPLAVYREIAAHLRQLVGVKADLILRPIESQPGAKFDYYQSQIAAVEITFTSEVDDCDRARVEEILDYYAQRYGAWENYTSLSQP